MNTLKHAAKRSLLLSVSVAGVVLASVAAANDFTVDWWTIDGGGDMRTTGGEFEVSATIGQRDANPVMTGGDLELIGGFWPVAMSGVLPCPGDLDGDGARNFTDFNYFAQAYGSHEGDPDWNPLADLDNDGVVNFTDFNYFAGYYGVPCP